MSSLDVINQAIYMMGNKVAPVTGTAPTFDGSAAGIAASFLYTPCVNAVARTYEWDFARRSISLSATANVGPFPAGFTLEYLYPTNGIELWQIMPALASLDLNNPLPTNWLVGNTLVGDAQTKVIWTDVANAVLIYNNQPTEDVWDSSFREAVARLLSSEMASALAGRTEASMFMLESASAARAIAQSRDG